MGMNGGVLYDLRQRTKEEYHLLDGEVVLDIIHFFEDLDVDFWILEGATRYTNRTSIETQEHARIFGETEIEIDLEPYLKNNTCNKLIIHCDKEYMPIVLERAKQYKNEACVGLESIRDMGLKRSQSTLVLNLKTVLPLEMNKMIWRCFKRLVSESV